MSELLRGTPELLHSCSELFLEVSELCRSDAELCRAVLRGLHSVAENLAREKITLQRKLFGAALQDLWVCLACPAISLSCDFS